MQTPKISFPFNGLDPIDVADKISQSVDDQQLELFKQLSP